MRFRLIACAAMATLAACSAGYMADSPLERRAFTSFEPVGKNQFRYVAKTWEDFLDPSTRVLKTSDQEKVRLEWLKQYLAMNGMCKDGYEITRRTVSLDIKEPYTQHKVFYVGECKSEG